MLMSYGLSNFAIAVPARSVRAGSSNVVERQNIEQLNMQNTVSQPLAELDTNADLDVY